MGTIKVVKNIVHDVVQEAKKEWHKEKLKDAKALILSKLKDIDRATKVLKNMERELEDLQVTVSEELE